MMTAVNMCNKYTLIWNAILTAFEGIRVRIGLRKIEIKSFGLGII